MLKTVVFLFFASLCFFMPLIAFREAFKDLSASFPKLFDSKMPDDFDFFSKSFLQKGIDSAALPQLKDFVKVVSGLNVSQTNGYSISFSKRFRWRGDVGRAVSFPGFYLALKNPANEVVGVLGFTLGFPLEICMVQGVKGNAARDFFKATRRHFDEELIDSFLGIAGNCIKIKGMPVALPKVVFSHLFFGERMSSEMRGRIIKKYCSPRPAFRMLESLKRPKLVDSVKALQRLEELPLSPFRIRGNTIARLKKKPL